MKKIPSTLKKQILIYTRRLYTAVFFAEHFRQPALIEYMHKEPRKCRQNFE